MEPRRLGCHGRVLHGEPGRRSAAWSRVFEIRVPDTTRLPWRVVLHVCSTLCFLSEMASKTLRFLQAIAPIVLLVRLAQASVQPQR
jgi:hypothetical protein